jgi:hypothetical protein
MKPLRLQPAVIALLLILGVFSGCTHKKPVLVAPQQQPPTAAPQPTPTPEPAATPAAEQPQAEQQPAAPAEQPKIYTGKPKAKSGKHAAVKKPKVVVQADKTAPAPQTGGQISPGPTPADAAHSQASTEQLLQSAETNINGISRQLSKEEEAIRAQVREYIKQSRNATTENDPARAHNLAVKAHLLSDELVKQR